MQNELGAVSDRLASLPVKGHTVETSKRLLAGLRRTCLGLEEFDLQLAEINAQLEADVH